MLVNTLRTKCMALGYIVLQMVIGMREPGMRAKGKGSGCIRLEMGKPNLVTGKMEFLTFQAHRTPHFQYLLLGSIIPKYSMQCRCILCIIIVIMDYLKSCYMFLYHLQLNDNMKTMLICG